MSKRIQLACLIDDDPIYLFATRRLIELVNFCEDLLIFNDGEEALDGLKVRFESDELKVPDVILLDIDMPVMDGWAFLDRIKVHMDAYPETSVYMVTSSIDPEDRNRAREYSIVSDYKVKPISVDDLEDILRQCA
jgi:CheY-like chemotaxis protein